MISYCEHCRVLSFLDCGVKTQGRLQFNFLTLSFQHTNLIFFTLIKPEEDPLNQERPRDVLENYLKKKKRRLSAWNLEHIG